MDIAERANSLAFDLSSMHIMNFATMRELGGIGYMRHEVAKVEFGPEFFRIERHQDGSLSMAFDGETIRQWSAYNSAGHPGYLTHRHGCLAGKVRFVNGKGETTDLVTDSYRYHVALAKEYFVPHLARYVDEVKRLVEERRSKFIKDEE